MSGGFCRCAHTADYEKKMRHYILRFLPHSFTGLVFSLVFFALSMTPSLLPRVWFMQGIATGLSISFGYAVGALCAAIGVWSSRTFAPVGRLRSRVQRFSRARWLALGSLSAVMIPVFLFLGAHWQSELHQQVGLPGEHEVTYVGVFFIAILLWQVLILIGRGFRAVSWWFAKVFGKILPPVASGVVAVGVVVCLSVLTVQGVTERVFRNSLEASFSLLDGETAPGVFPPSSALRSGSPDSFESWDSLGYQGRIFVSDGPSSDAISQVTGRPAEEPIRVYAGLESAESLDQLADRVVAEMVRTGAFQRESLLVVTTTGRGWVNEAVADGFEYVNNGDSAIAAMQYSFLPSPVAFLANRESPQEAGRVLFDKVQAEWLTLPEESRPRLVMYGESLGSFGGQSAFAGVEQMLDSIDGGLFIGAPNFTEPWSTITASRDEGSSEFLPVFDQGRQVRFFSKEDDLHLPGAWDDNPRVVYWQHPGDAIIWWNFSLLYSKPDWLREALPDDIHSGVRWIPFVTFWQVTLDMAFAAEVPDGFGHTYGEDAADLWDWIIQPEGWSPEAAENARLALREIMDERLGPAPSPVIDYN